MILHNLAKRDDLSIYFYTTGAGAGLQQKIWGVVGCSSFFTGSGFPYAMKHSTHALGYTPDKFVSVPMAVDLAMAAYVQSYVPGKQSIGLGLTASVASVKEHRGDHKIIVSTMTNGKSLTGQIVLPKGTGRARRLLDGRIADELALEMLLHAVDPKHPLPKFILDIAVEYIETDNVVSSSLKQKPYFDKLGNRAEAPIGKILFYPGNFNPIHEGHVGAAEAALDVLAERFGQRAEVVFSTTINPPHKPALSSTEILQRVAMLKGRNFLITDGDARYLDKALLNPGVPFVIGVDALIRMLSPEWGIPTEDLLSILAGINARFFVVGRLVDGKFMSLSEVEDKFPILLKYHKNFEPVNGRWDVSSTELRNKSKQ